MRTVWKYVEIKNLRQARKCEMICAYHDSPTLNYTFYKHEEKAVKAVSDAKKGKCRLLVWREVDVPDDWKPQIPD